MLVTLFIVLIGPPALRAGSPATDASPAAIESALEHASLRGNPAAVAEAARLLDTALARSPQSPELLYLRGFAQYAAAHALNPAKNKAAIVAALEAATTSLAEVHGDPWEPEAMALEGAIYGQLIGLKGGMTAMTLGPKSGSLTAAAMQRLPGSPRVQLFRAEILEHTPEMFGGDRAAAAKLYQEAVDGFAAGEKSPGPRWGCVDALTWLGISRRAAHDITGATAAWRQALALEPDDRYVKFALLPAVQQKTAP